MAGAPPITQTRIQSAESDYALIEIEVPTGVYVLRLNVSLMRLRDAGDLVTVLIDDVKR